MPSLRQFRYLVALAETQHFRKAAERCHVTQPALSTQIQQLEAELGVQLVERSRRGAVLTAAGRDVVRRSRSVLDEVEALVDAARSMRGRLVGPLRLGVIPTIAPYFLPEAVPRIGRAYPELQLFVREDKTDALIAQLRAGEIELVLLALPVPADDLVGAELFGDPFLVAAPPDHRFRETDRVEVADLADELLLLLEDGHCLRDQALEVCALGGTVHEADFRATSLNTLVQMVSGGLGVTLLPALALDREPRWRDMLAVRPFAAPEPGRRIGLLWRRSSGRKAAFRELARLMADRPADHSAD